jgi:hypothetical protein
LQSLQLRHFERITGAVLLYLEPEKLMNRLDCLSISSRDPDLGAARSFFRGVGNLALQTFHRFHSGRRACMDEHRDGEIARRKERGDLLQVLSNGLPARQVLRVVCLDLDRAAVANR